MEKLQELKIDFADAVINLEIAQNRYNEIKRKLAEELGKPKLKIEPKA